MHHGSSADLNLCATLFNNSTYPLIIKPSEDDDLHVIQVIDLPTCEEFT